MEADMQADPASTLEQLDAIENATWIDRGPTPPPLWQRIAARTVTIVLLTAYFGLLSANRASERR